ncbi:hypothetical protein PFFCH_02681 [Plasmodium falciparum FCH/4]|uniref:Uncharacterized protein n=2 Tax=Plasmodium falciparum TaxID=5833 RepID=A0A024VNR5_PLAFA|nr:hypothetical protein PFFCH_02681 [Plasmodium falciparum FCH/4]
MNSLSYHENDDICSSYTQKKRKVLQNKDNFEEDNFSQDNELSDISSKDNRCVHMNNYVKQIRNSRSLSDISLNLTKYTLESEKILCDIINDNFNMTIKVSSLNDLPYFFDEEKIQ